MISHLYFPEYTFDSSVKCEKSKVVIAAYIDVLCSLRKKYQKTHPVTCLVSTRWMTVDETGIEPDTNWRQYSHFFLQLT